LQRPRGLPATGAAKRAPNCEVQQYWRRTPSPQGPELLSQFVPEVYLVIDTNVLLLHLDVVRQFVDDIEAQSLPLQVIIPTAVLSELDQ
jgi:hypothetical protein